MAVSKAQQKAVQKYVKDKYDRVVLRVKRRMYKFTQAATVSV